MDGRKICVFGAVVFLLIGKECESVFGSRGNVQTIGENHGVCIIVKGRILSEG